ncbi:hypothetical protein ACFYY5_29105 [Nocardia elegans]|uniref:Uncharacterized protein n=1 Tax=Nocardia elegans TaxID=300029 RepID=A0ABW6TLA4_9NOCA
MSLEKVQSDRTYRLWDTEYMLIGTWSQLPPPDELIDGRHLTIDHSNGLRWSGRIENGEPVHDSEYLTKILTWPWNPLLPENPERTA